MYTALLFQGLEGRDIQGPSTDLAFHHVCDVYEGLLRERQNHV